MIESADRRDSGFTLVEAIVVIGVMGLIAIVIAGAFVVIARSTPAAEARNDDSRSLLGLTNYLPLDVSSTPVSNIAIPGAPTGCGVSDGTSLLSLSWTDFASSEVTEVNYRLVDRSGWRVVRFGCTAGTPVSVNLTSVLAEGVSTPSPVPVVVSPLFGDHDKDSSVITPDQQVGVSLVITTLVGTTQRIDAVSDNNPQTLGPISVTSTTTPTTTPTPNAQPVASDKIFDAWPGQAVIVNLEATDANGDPLTASIDPTMPLPALWSASFTGLEMTLTPDPAATPGTYLFGYRATDPLGDYGSAEVIVTIVPVGSTTTTSTTTTTTSTSTTTTTIPCTVSSASINRASVSNGVHEDVDDLKQSVTITVARSGSCGELVLTFVPDANPPAAPQTLSFSGGTQITIEKADYAWSDGVHVLSVRNGATGPQLASVTLTVT